MLNIQVPRNLPPGGSLADALLKQWPDYVAYLSSFATIGIMWINHHRLFLLIRRIDHLLLVFNGLLLLSITFLPFPTALVSEYAGHPDENVAAVVYAGTFVVIAIFFNLLWRYASYHRRLLGSDVETSEIDEINRSYRVAPFLYLAAFILAFVNVIASLAIVIGLAIFFALPRPDHRPVRH